MSFLVPKERGAIIRGGAIFGGNTVCVAVRIHIQNIVQAIVITHIFRSKVEHVIDDTSKL